MTYNLSLAKRLCIRLGLAVTSNRTAAWQFWKLKLDPSELRDSPTNSPRASLQTRYDGWHKTKSVLVARNCALHIDQKR